MFRETIFATINTQGKLISNCIFRPVIVVGMEVLVTRESEAADMSNFGSHVIRDHHYKDQIGKDKPSIYTKRCGNGRQAPTVYLSTCSRCPVGVKYIKLHLYAGRFVFAKILIEPTNVAHSCPKWIPNFPRSSDSSSIYLKYVVSIID